MIPPGIPLNEKERLAILYQLNILDTEKKERFDRITRIACKLFHVPIAVISFMEAERQWMKSTEGFEIQESSRQTSFCGHAILSDEIMYVEDATKDTRFHDNPFVLGNPQIRFYLGCPLQIQKCNVGVFCLIDDKSRRLDEIDQTAMRDLAEMVELELESLHLSTTDELTGLSNRRGFLKIAHYLFQMCQRENKKFSLLFFDLNRFKQINDKFGHAEGDRVLQFFSECLLQEFRGSDVIARIGGDEFCVFCTGMDINDIEDMAARLKKCLKSYRKKNIAIEFSMGSVQSHEKTNLSLEDMLVLADSKMYYDKKK